MELVECQPLLEWLANNYKNFGATLEIITDKSQEGSQFVRGFGGIGGKYPLFLRYFSIVPSGSILNPYFVEINFKRVFIHAANGIDRNSTLQSRFSVATG